MKISVIIQGEGKGHLSQAMEAIEMVRVRGGEVTGCYLGRSLFRKPPAYFREAFPLAVKTFLSPNFLRTPDRKGIRIALSLVLNALLIPVYLFEVLRLGIMLQHDGSSQLMNFYDPVGALAGKWFRRRTRKVLISHHFYLSHPDFIHPHGLERSYFWLQLMNHIMIRKADEVMALSFRKGSRKGKITVVPPLVTRKLQRKQSAQHGADLHTKGGQQWGEGLQRKDAQQRGGDAHSQERLQGGEDAHKDAQQRGGDAHGEDARQPGEDLQWESMGQNKGALNGKEDLRSEERFRGAGIRASVSGDAAGGPRVSQEKGPDLCYFLETGFVEEMLQYYRDRAHLAADLFVEDPGQFSPLENVRLHAADRTQFLAVMQHAGRVICTAGFDTVAEAFYLGVPVFVIPAENHYEQYCNALDAVRTGMAFQLESLEDLDDVFFEPVSNARYLKWLETGHEALFHYLSRYY